MVVEIEIRVGYQMYQKMTETFRSSLGIWPMQILLTLTSSLDFAGDHPQVVAAWNFEIANSYFQKDVAPQFLLQWSQDVIFPHYKGRTLW